MAKQRRWKHRLARMASHWRKAATVAAGGLTVAMGYHVVLGKNGLIAFQHKRQESTTLAQQAKSLTEENERLQDHVSRLETDPSAIEHQAREELHYTRPGEVIYTLPAPPRANQTQGAASH